jgi:hypothetical protein
MGTVSDPSRSRAAAIVLLSLWQDAVTSSA